MVCTKRYHFNKGFMEKFPYKLTFLEYGDSENWFWSKYNSSNQNLARSHHNSSVLVNVSCGGLSCIGWLCCTFSCPMYNKWVVSECIIWAISQRLQALPYLFCYSVYTLSTTACAGSKRLSRTWKIMDEMSLSPFYLFMSCPEILADVSFGFFPFIQTWCFTTIALAPIVMMEYLSYHCVVHC